jgi:hypothetical protein
VQLSALVGLLIGSLVAGTLPPCGNTPRHMSYGGMTFSLQHLHLVETAQIFCLAEDKAPNVCMYML